MIGAGAAFAAAMLPAPRRIFAQTSAPSVQRYKVAACDWMLLKRQKLGAIKLSKDCGLDGVVVDMGPLGNRPDIENELRKDVVRRQFLDQSRELGVEIPVIALSCFYGQSWADHPKADDFATECVELMTKMGAKSGYLPIRSKKDDPDAHTKVVEHLKRVAPKAETAKVVLAVEAPVNIDGYKRLLDDVGSPSIQVAYHLGNLLEMGGVDLYEGIRQLGRDRIGQVFMSGPDGKHLEDGPIDCKKVKAVLDEIGWSGWLILERSRTNPRDVKGNFTANAKYLKSLFQA
jgi:L-ribulose-5-phosphate 3-epimerase